MIPEDRFSTTPVPGALLNPWTRRDDLSQHWGPIALSDPGQGLLVRLWEARIETGDTVIIRAPGVADAVLFSRAGTITEVSVAFDQNGRPMVAFVEDGSPYLWWFDPVPGQQVFMPLALDTINPRLTLDDARPQSLSDSDVILAYIRAGTVRYRQQRDRFDTEFTPPVGPGGSPLSANGLRHISINSVLRLQFTLEGEGDEDWTLAALVEAIALGANVPSERLRFDQGMYQVIVPGYGTSPDYAVDTSIMALSHVFFFDQQDADGYIGYALRGGARRRSSPKTTCSKARTK